MAFESVRFHNFRNVVDGEIPVARRQVFFIGENGQGKTNFLEAVYTLCYGKSFRSSTDNVMVCHGKESMAIAGKHSSAKDPGRHSEIRVMLRNGRKEIQLDDKPIAERTELVERFPCVVFCHDDLDFVRGSPDQQRLFFDQTACLLYPEYLGNLRDYNKILKTRNLLLKDQRTDLIGVYDEQLVRFGLLLREKRQQLVEVFNSHFTSLFEQVSVGMDGVSIAYRSSWQGLDMEGAFRKLADRLPADLSLRTTSSGVHRDKFVFLNGKADFSLSASTGQFRLMSLLLRLCQACLIEKLCGKQPILLLDDVLLELDFEKRKRFLSCLPEHEQAFYTFLPDEQIDAYAGDDTIVYSVTNGGFHEKSR
jgi:DNA replication and repair protein RecF